MKEYAEMSFWQSLRTVLLTAKVVFRLDWKNIPAFVGNRFFQTLQPFVALFFSARILDALASGAAWESVLKWVVIGVGSTYGVYLLERMTACISSVEGIALYWQLYQEMSRVMMKADYRELEGPAIRQDKERIERSSNMYWYGPWEVPGVLMSVVQGLAVIISALALAWPIFLPVKGEGFPWGMAAMAGLIVGSVVYSLAVEKRLYRMKEDGLDGLSKESRMQNFLIGYIGEQQAAKDVRLYAMQGMIRKYYERCNERILEIEGGRLMLQGRADGLRGAMAQGVGVFAYLIVGARALAGVFGVGSVVQYVGAITKLSDGIRELVYSVQHIKMQGPHCQEYLDFIGEGKEGDKYIHEQDGDRDVPTEGQDAVIEFDHVSFCYPGTEEMVLKDICLTIKKGVHLAIVGMNGSGKTTLIKLLCRLYRPTMGRILLNGTDIGEYSYEQYQQLFSVVFQDFQLMALPLGENVASGSSYEEERVWDCLEKAGAEEWARGLPKGLLQPLYRVGADGVNVSGGEAQKIAIARALYKDAPFVVLDEPTAALDPLAEAEIYSRFQELTLGKGAVYISHRLSSCRFCDTIAVFDKGRLAELGGHEELLARTGKYAELWEAQAQYYAGNSESRAAQVSAVPHAGI